MSAYPKPFKYTTSAPRTTAMANPGTGPAAKMLEKNGSSLSVAGPVPCATAAETLTRRNPNVTSRNVETTMA